MIPGDEWRASAACRNQTDLFYPPATAAWQKLLVLQAEAVTMCARCPVLAECRSWALDSLLDPCPDAVLGGMTPEVRRTLRDRYHHREA